LVSKALEQKSGIAMGVDYQALEAPQNRTTSFKQQQAARSA